jgi:hypothetical protein
MGTIYNLAFEYVHQNGQSIVFKEKDGQKLSVNNLNSVQMKMMQSNRIPHLLSMTVENIDLTTRLHFNINSKNKVTSFFRNNSTNMNDYYQLFLSIIKALEDSSSYMLNQDNFVLRSDLIYVGENASDVSLVYLPIKDVKKETSFAEEMKQLLTDIAGEVEGLQGNEFKSILNYIKNASFSLNGLKKLLLELISLRSNVNQFQTHDSYNASNNGMAMEGVATSTQGPVGANHGQKSGQKKIEPNYDDVVPRSQKKSKNKVKKKLPPLTSRQKVYMFAGAALALALIWKLYDTNPSTVILGVCGGLSVLIVVALIVFAKYWRPGVSPIEIPSDGEKMDEGKTTNIQRQQAPQVQSQPQQPNMAVKPTVYNQTTPQQMERTYNQVPTQQSRVSPTSFQDFYSPEQGVAASMDTTLLTVDSDDTVLLEDEANLDFLEKDEVLPLLQRTGDDGKVKTIVINNRNFLIGRNTDSVHFTDDATGVSRIHAEIIRIDSTSYGIKDLGSKNGTKLNGNTLVPYKVYALNEDDEFILGKANYTFKWSSSE